MNIIKMIAKDPKNGKIINYDGQELNVPSWANYVSIDIDGNLCVHRVRPELDYEDGIWVNDNLFNKTICLVESDIDFEDSLMEIKYLTK